MTDIANVTSIIKSRCGAMLAIIHTYIFVYVILSLIGHDHSAGGQLLLPSATANLSPPFNMT
jgi:hypothetical protein